MKDITFFYKNIFNEILKPYFQKTIMIGAFVVYVVKKINIAFYNCFQNILGTKGYTYLLGYELWI